MQYKTIDELGEISKQGGVSFYHQLYRLLSAALNDGSIAAGSALPSESELMERFDVSRNTVRRALGQLEQEKRIVRRRGSGSFARRVEQTKLSQDSFAEILHDFTSAKADSSSRLLRVQACKTPEFIRRKDPDFAEQSLIVQRCRSFKDEPIMFSTSYVPEPIGARLTRRSLGRDVVSGALESLGMVPHAAEQITTAVLADAFVARYLGIDPSSPVLCIHRLIRDKAGRSIEHQSHLYRPDLAALRARLLIERTSGGLRWSSAQSPGLPVAL